jgi:hypothetical protein
MEIQPEVRIELLEKQDNAHSLYTVTVKLYIYSYVVIGTLLVN